MSARQLVTRSGETVADSAIEEFGAGLRGSLIRPDDAGYDEARALWNGMIDKRPGLIVRCAGASDVMAAVDFARAHDVVLAVRGGGHGVAGNAMCDDGLVIDLSLMKGVRVDPEQRTVRAQGGVNWGDFDHETQAFGLATTGGMVTHTGIAGLTLGGGIGWLMRKHGLTCDNLRSADVVLADGSLVTADASRNSDLFWGIRGGGGNFGVVTSFEYQLHPVGPMILGGLVAYPFDQARDVMQFYREYAASSPDELSLMLAILVAPPAPFVPAEVVGKTITSVVACYAGDLAEGEEALRPLRSFGPPAIDIIQPMPYLARQSTFDAFVPMGIRSYWKADNLAALPDEAIDACLAHAQSFVSPMSQVHIQVLGGAIARVASSATAYPSRDAAHSLNIVSLWANPADDANNTAWTRDLWAAMRPFSQGGVYVNFLGEEGEDRVRAAYGANYDRLAAIKGKYDPTNLFRLNQNIKPEG